MIHLLFVRQSRPTGRNLAKALSIHFGTRPRPSHHIEYLIRWGSAKKPELDRQVSGVLNSASAVARASHKYRSLQLLQEAGLPIPAFSRYPEDLAYPIFGRDFHHSGGKDIIQYDSLEDAIGSNRDFYVSVLPSSSERRIHVFRGTVLRVQGKYFDGDGERQPTIRNRTNGYVFRTPNKKLHTRRLEDAIQAVEVLGLDFGAVDLLLDGEQHYILEVNSAPACRPMNAAAYAQAMANWCNEQDIDGVIIPDNNYFMAMGLDDETARA